jgi:tRNA A-37 threonylcarbamoyl transferase component Bud32
MDREKSPASTPARPATAPDMPLEADLSGRQLGDYRLLRRLGRGGMAEVYLAEQVSLQRHVAVKVLRGALAHDEQYIRRFRQEARAIAAIVHGNIVQVYEVGCVDGVHFIAQEYVQGQNLREWIVRHGPPDLRLALHIMRQVAAALWRAAERGIVHRDIKPENILLTHSGEVKVADFGLARMLGGEAVDLTQVGVALGTPLYMSPEQVEGRPLDHRSDIYSFGVTCYHMLSGTPPFRGETALAIAVQHVKSPPPRLETLRPDLPPALCRVVHKMLEKDPAHRYSSARELLRDLRAVAAEHLAELEDGDDLWKDLSAELAVGLQATQRLDSLMKTEAVLIAQRQSKQPLLLGAALVVAGALAAVALGLLLRPPPLLSGTANGPAGVQPMPTAASQFALAALNPLSEEHWLAVIEYHPNDEGYVALAKKELGLLRLSNNDYARALQTFDEFSRLVEPSTRNLRAFGLAGQSIVYALQGDTARSLRVLTEFWEIRDALASGSGVDRRMEAILRGVVQQHLQQIRERDELMAQQAESWLQQRFRSDN